MLKEKLSSGKLVVGSWVMLRDPISVEVMADSGLDWLAIDMEHAPISISEAADLIRVGVRCGIEMLVRVPDHNVTTIKQVLDAGATGVIVPDVRTVEQAKLILSFMRYPSSDFRDSGNRGSGLASAQGYGRKFSNYFSEWNDRVVFIPMIEHIDAIKNAADIAAINGVDALFVGPYDLSASMGKPGMLNDPRVSAAVAQIVDAAKSAQKTAGFHGVPPDIDHSLEKIMTGVRLLAFSADVFFIRNQIDMFMEEINKMRAKGL